MNFDAVGLDVHLVGTVWQNQTNGETYVLPLSLDHPITLTEAKVLYYDELDTLRLINKAWLIEGRTYQGEHGKAVTTTLCRMRKQVEPKLMWKVFRRDGFQCVYCGDEEGPMTYDHYIPQCQGGPTNIENGRTACRKCNQMKGSAMPNEWMASKELIQRKAWISKLKEKRNEHESKVATTSPTTIL